MVYVLRIFRKDTKSWNNLCNCPKLFDDFSKIKSKLNIQSSHSGCILISIINRC